MERLVEWISWLCNENIGMIMLVGICGLGMIFSLISLVFFHYMIKFGGAMKNWLRYPNRSLPAGTRSLVVVVMLLIPTLAWAGAPENDILSELAQGRKELAIWLIIVVSLAYIATASFILYELRLIKKRLIGKSLKGG